MFRLKNSAARGLKSQDSVPTGRETQRDLRMKTGEKNRYTFGACTHPESKDRHSITHCHTGCDGVGRLRDRRPFRQTDNCEEPSHPSSRINMEITF